MSKAMTPEQLKMLAMQMKAGKIPAGLLKPEKKKVATNKVFGGKLKKIPQFLLDCFQEIEDKPREGLFRRCGDKKQLEDCRRRIDDFEDVDMSKIHVFNCCSLIKLYFREMPESLCQPIDKFTEIGKEEDPEKRKVAVKKVLKEETPEVNRNLLFHLCTLLYELTQNPTILMGSRNLAIVFVPNFFPMHGQNEGTKFFMSLIDNFRYIFDADKSRKKVTFSDDFNMAAKYGVREPKHHIACRDLYKSWLQMTKNVAVRYKRENKRPMFEIYKMMCEGLFVKYLKSLVEDRKLLQKREESKKELFIVLQKEFKEKLDFSLEEKLKRSLERLIDQGVDFVQRVFRLKPVGKFQWPAPGTDFDTDGFVFKNKKSDGLKDTQKNLVVKATLFPGFFSKQLVFVKPGVLCMKKKEFEAGIKGLTIEELDEMDSSSEEEEESDDSDEDSEEETDEESDESSEEDSSSEESDEEEE